MVAFANLLVALAASAGPAPASDTPTIAWAPIPGCPEASVLRARVERLIGRALRDGDEAVTVTAEVVDGDPLQLALAVRSDTGVRERTITAPTCDDLVEIAAVVIAVAVDPSASLLPGDEPPPPEPPPTPEPAPKPEVAPPPAPTQPPASKPKRRRPTGTLGVFAGVGLGVVPGATAALGGSGGVRWTRARVDVAIEHDVAATERTSDGARGVDVRATVGLVQGCWVAPVGRVLELPLCGGVSAGAVRGRGFGVPRPETRRATWAGVHAQVGLWVAPLPRRRWFALGPMLRVGAPVVRPEFALDGFGVVWRTRPATFVAAFAVELRFP